MSVPSSAENTLLGDSKNAARPSAGQAALSTRGLADGRHNERAFSPPTRCPLVDARSSMPATRMIDCFGSEIYRSGGRIDGGADGVPATVTNAPGRSARSSHLMRQSPQAGQRSRSQAGRCSTAGGTPQPAQDASRSLHGNGKYGIRTLGRSTLGMAPSVPQMAGSGACRLPGLRRGVASLHSTGDLIFIALARHPTLRGTMAGLAG
jgi:hypothetical protein